VFHEARVLAVNGGGTERHNAHSRVLGRRAQPAEAALNDGYALSLPWPECALERRAARASPQPVWFEAP